MLISILSDNHAINLPKQHCFCPTLPFSFAISWVNSNIYFTFVIELRKNLFEYVPIAMHITRVNVVARVLTDSIHTPSVRFWRVR